MYVTGLMSGQLSYVVKLLGKIMPVCVDLVWKCLQRQTSEFDDKWLWQESGRSSSRTALCCSVCRKAAKWERQNGRLCKRGTVLCTQYLHVALGLQLSSAE